MNKSTINKSREIPFLEDFSTEEINKYLDIFLIISKDYCQDSLNYSIIEGIIYNIREGKYSGLSYSTKILDLLSYSDFRKLFNNYLEENNLGNFSFYNCGVILNKLLTILKKMDSGDKIDDSILSIIKGLNKKTEIEDLTRFTQKDVDEVLDSIFSTSESKENGREIIKYRYKREIDSRISIYIEEENRLKSFELIKRIGNITIYKNDKGEYFLREYLIKPFIKVDLLKGVSFIQNQNGKRSKINLKIEIINGLEEIILELKYIN